MHGSIFFVVSAALTSAAATGQQSSLGYGVTRPGSHLRKNFGQRPSTLSQRPLRSLAISRAEKPDVKKFQEDLEQKFVEKRVEMLEETQKDKADAAPIGTQGGTAPLGEFWDPASFTRDADPNQVRRYREAELTHGRVAMLGALGFLVQEKFSPLFGGNIDGPAVYHFQEISKIAPSFWYPVFLAIAIAEVGRAKLGWEDPVSGSLWGLKPSYEPGNLGFDPLGLYPKDASSAVQMKNKELNNGRLAMVKSFVMTNKCLCSPAQLKFHAG